MAKIGSINKNPAAVALGRLGGLKGGKAGNAKLTSVRRMASARIVPEPATAAPS